MSQKMLLRASEESWRAQKSYLRFRPSGLVQEVKAFERVRGRV